MDVRAAGGIRGDLEGVGCTVCPGVVHLHDLAAQHLAAHKAVIQHAVEGVVGFRHHILVAVSGDDGTEGAAGGVQDLLEEVRNDDGPHAVVLQVHHIHAAVLGGQHPQEVLGVPLLGQGALQFFVQALELTLLPVAAVVGQLVLLHGLLGLVHGRFQLAQIVGVLDAHRDLAVLLSQEHAHPVGGGPCVVGWQVGGEHDEFVTAHAVDAAAYKELAGGVGNGAQQVVAAAVAQVIVHLMQAHHVDVGAHHGIVIRILQLPQVALILAAVGKAGQGVVAVGEVQLLTQLVGLCVLPHQHGGPGVLGAAAAAGQHFHGDPHELVGHLLAEAVELRLLGVEQGVLQQGQVHLLLEHLCIVRVHDLFIHQTVAEGGKVLFLGQVCAGQAGIPLDHPIGAGDQVKQRDFQQIVGKDLICLQGQCRLFRVRVLRSGAVVAAHQVAAYIPVVGVIGLGQQLFSVFNGHGLEEVVALRIQAVGSLQHGHLLRGLHTLGNDGQIEPVSHIDHRFHDLHTLAVVLLVHVDELHVQLDGIHVGVLEHVQRRVAAAKVVHHHREALAVQALDGVFHHRGVLGQHGLGDLGQQELGLQLVFLHQIREDLRHVQIHDVHHGHVHRHGHQIAVAGLPLLQRLADGFPDVLVQPGDQAGALQQGHELGRLHAAAGGVVPAHQCFHANDGAGHAVALGLQEKGEFVVVQRMLQLTQQLLLGLEAVQHGRGKAVDAAAGMVRVHHGDLGVVAQGGGVRFRMLAHRAQAQCQKEGDILMIGAHAGLQRDHDVLLLHAVIRQAEEKVIVAPVAHRAAGGLLIVQQMAGQGVQQGIALLGAVKLVVQPEVLNVDGRDAPLFGFVCVQKVLQMLQEVLLACNGCKGTRLYCADGCILNGFIRHGHPSQSGKNCQLQT